MLGVPDTVSHTVTVNAPPTASFAFSPARPEVGQTRGLRRLRLDDDDRRSPNGSFAWDFDNNGAFDDATGQAAHGSFATAGAKTVRLQVTDADGAASIATATGDRERGADRELHVHADRAR